MIEADPGRMHQDGARMAGTAATASAIVTATATHRNMKAGKSGDLAAPEAANYLRYWRDRRKVSLAQLAARIETAGRQYASPKTLNRWEKGETKLPAWALAEVAAALKVTEAELLHGPRDADPALPAHVSAAYTGLDLEIAEHVISMGYTSWIASRPQEARRAAESVVPWLEALQRRAPRSAQAREGAHLLARGHELLGALALDQLDNETAVSRFRQALTLSEELADPDLTVAHMTELGEAYRRGGRMDLALGLMGQALEKSERTGRATRGYILEMLAYTCADAGDEAGFLRHIAEATDLLGHAGEGSGAPRRDFIPFEVFEIRGKATRDFGRPTEALGYFEEAERALLSRPNVPRWHAVVTIGKAQALCDAGELEAGVDLAIRGMTLSHHCQSPRQMNRVRKLMRRLDTSPTAAHPALRPLRDLVQDIYVGGHDPLDWRPRHAM